MSGMVSMMKKDMDQCFESGPVTDQPQQEEIIEEHFKQTILIKEKEKDIHRLASNEAGFDTEPKYFEETEFREERNKTPRSSLGDEDEELTAAPQMSNENKEITIYEPLLEEVHIARKPKKLTPTAKKDMSGLVSILKNNLDHSLETRSLSVAPDMNNENEEITIDEQLFEEVYVGKKIDNQAATAVKDMSGLASLMTTDLHQCLERKFDEQPQRQVTEEMFEQVNLAKERETDIDSFVSDEVESSYEEKLENTNEQNFGESPVVFTNPFETLSEWPQRPVDLNNLDIVGFDEPVQEHYQQDSLEASPVMEDMSSRKSPDSIEPSPSRESPCPDSLEGSPTQSYCTGDGALPAKAAVYEDYASQLKACFAFDTNISKDDNESESVTQMEGDKSPSFHEDEKETINQFTPEEEMFKMAAKIKTFDEIEQEAKTKRDTSPYAPSCTSDHEDVELDKQMGPAVPSSFQDSPEKSFEKTVAETDIDSSHSMHEEREEFESQISTEFQGSEKSLRIYEESSSDGDPQPHKDNLLQGIVEPSTVVCAKETQYFTSGFDDPVAYNEWADEQRDYDHAEDSELHQSPAQSPSDDQTPEQFQYEEGKLFEMTRGGAIDLTRNFDEEVEGYGFFQVEGHQVDEVSEEAEDEQSTMPKFDDDDSVGEEIPQKPIKQIVPIPKPRTLLTPSCEKSKSDKHISEADLGSSTEVQLGSPTELEKLTIIEGDDKRPIGISVNYPDSTIAVNESSTNMATLEHQKQSCDLLYSSADEDEEDQCSVIEMSFSGSQAIVNQGGITKEDSQIKLDRAQKFSEHDLVSKTEDLAMIRRTRSETDGAPSKTSGKNNRSCSDSAQPTYESSLTLALPSTKQVKEIHISKTEESSISLDTDDISSSSHKSPDSVIFTYDIPTSSSLHLDPLTAVQPSSGTADVFESRPTWDDTVGNQMRRITDEQTPQCMAVDWQDDADRKEETLSIIADLLGFSWTELARELEFNEDDIQLVRTQNPNSLQEQSHALLQHWVEREGKHATEDCLIKRLTKINRMDIVHLIETQMNKSTQEQTSRTYAEIEKTLDHSEVSVALSSVQEDVDSPRFVRRVESDRKPPPAVSEEDLSVASLLDIPSWAEPAGQTHSESMHGDLLEELEISHELNPNLWTSDDVISHEHARYVNLEEQISTPKLPTERLKGTSGPTGFASPKIHQETLKITEDNTDTDRNNEVLQKCLDEFEVPPFKEFHGHPKSPWGHNVNMAYDPFTSSNGNPKTQVNNVGFQDNIYFIDDDDVLTVASTVAPVKYQLMDDSKNTHMACDSTESSDIRSSMSPNAEKCRAKTVSSSLYLPIYTRQTSDYDETSSTSIDYDTCVPEKCFSPAEFWTLSETLPRLSSPESVMSISDYRAMSPDSPLSKRKGFTTDLPVMDVSWALYSSSYKCTSPELKIIENITDPNSNVCDSRLQFGGTDKPAENFVSRVAEHSSSLPDSVLIQQDFPSLPSNILPFECLHEETSFNRNALHGLATINHEYKLSDMDWRPSSPQSQTSQHSFSFLELLHSESTRSQLMSQYCDYFLQYSGDTQPLPQMTQDQTEPTNVRTFETKSSLGHIYLQDDNYKTSNAFLSQDVAHSRQNSDLQYYANAPASHKTECYDENDLNAEKPESLQRIREVMIDKVGTESVNGKQMSIQSRPQDLEESKNTWESYLDYWFSKLAPQPNVLQPSTYDPKPCISDLRKNRVENNQNTDSVESSLMKQSTEVNIYSEHKLHRPLTEMATSLSQIQSKKPVIFNLVERPKYTLEFQKDKTMTICKETPSNVEDLVQSKWQEYLVTSSTEGGVSIINSFLCSELNEQEKDKHCNFFLNYNGDNLQPRNEHSDLSLKHSYENSEPKIHYSCSSEKEAFRKEAEVSLILGQPQSCARPFTYADVVRGFTREKPADATAFESRPILLMTDSFDEFSDSSTTELAIGERPYSPESIASLCELTALSPDSPVPQFDIAQIENHGIEQRSYTPQSSVSDWEGRDFCITNLFDETRPLSPQSVSSDMELHLLFSNRALSPDSVSSDLDTALLRDWLLDFRASSPESVASVKKCLYSPNLQHCNYYIRYSEDRPDSSLSSLSDVEYSELSIKDLFDDSRPESPDSVSSENFRTETKVSLLLGQPQSCARPFTYADVVRGLTREKPTDATAFDSRPILLMTDSYDELSDSSIGELAIGERSYSPDSLASLCELTALSPDSPVPQCDIAHIENHGIEQRSYTPQSSVSDWEGRDFCLTNLFDETRPLSPQSISSEMELDLLFSKRALSPDSVSSDLDTALLRDWLLDFRASSPESVASVEKCLYGPDLKHCNYYLSYSEDMPDSSRSSLSDVEYSQLCNKDLFDDSRPESPVSVSSENFRTEKQVSLRFGQPQSCVRPFTYTDVVRGFTQEKTADGTVFESRPILLMTDSFDEFSDSSTTELDIGERPYSPESIASLCELTALSPDSPVPQFDIAQIENQGQCIDQRSYTPQSSVSDWEGRDFCLTNLFDETRPLSPQSVSSDMELDLLFSNRALSPDSVSSDLDTALLRNWLLDFRASSPESVASVEKCLYCLDLKHCNYYLRYSEDRPDSSLSSLTDVAYSEQCIKDLFDDSRPESPDSVSSEDLRTETKLSLILGQPQSCSRPFTYADVVRGLKREKPADATAFESRPILLMTDSFDDFSDSSTTELAIGERPYSPESVASLCELTALSPDSPVPQFDIAQIDNQGQCIDQRSYTPQSSVSDWEGRDFCLTKLFDETRPLSPQSVSSDMELDLLFSNRALSPDSVSSDLDSALLRDWLLDFRASSPESVASVKKCLYGPDLQHCNYYLRYSEDRPDSPLSSLSDVEYSELCIKDLFDDSRPESPDSVSSEDFRTETKVSLLLGQPQSCARPFTYADVVRGLTREKTADATAFESRPILLMTDSFDEFSDSSTTELAIGERPYSPESVASLCELTALSPDSPIPQFDKAQTENHGIEQRSYTPQSSVSDWEGRDFCLSNLFDDTRPLSPQSVSSDMELDLLFSNRALSPDSVSSDLDTALLRDWLLDFRASSPESVASVKKCSYCPDLQHCNYYLRYSEDRPNSPLSSLSDVEYSELCIKDLFDDSRPESPDSVSSENFRTETKVSLIIGQPQSCAGPLTYADVVRSFTQEKTADAMYNVTAFEFGPILLMTDSFDELSDSSISELDIGERPYSPESVASVCEFTALSPDSPVPQFDIPQIENHGINQRSYSPQSSVSDWEGHDLCLTNLFDETRPLSPQSVSSDMELDLLFSDRALSPDSVSSGLDTALLRDWLLDFRASSPESVASVKKCLYSPDLQHCNYYLRYSECRPNSPLSSLSDVEYSELCIKDLFDDSRPESPDSISSEIFRTETKVSLTLGRPLSYARPFTYADVVRGFTQEKPPGAMYNVTASESRPILRMTDSFDEFSDSSTAELAIDERPYSPESLASLCELTALSPDSPVPQFDIAQIENHGIDQRSYTPQSSVSDWEGRDFCLSNLFDETRPLSPKSVSSDMELDLLFSNRALSPDSVSSALDTSLQRVLLDFKASSPDSAASVEEFSFCSDMIFGQNNRQHCNYYLWYSEDRPVPLPSTLSYAESSELCLNNFSDNNSVINAGQYQFHRSTFTPTNVSSMSPVFKDLHPYKKLISHLLDPLYKGNCSSFKMFLNLDEEQTSFYDPQPLASFLVVDEPSKLSLCSFTTINPNLPIQSSTCFTDNSTTQNCPSDCQILPSSYQFLPVSSDASVLDQKFVGQCHDEIKPDSSKPVLDVETQNLTPHQNTANQSFIDPCLSELKPSAPEILDSEFLLKQQFEKYLIDQSVDTDPRPLYKQFHKKLMAHIYDPVYRREHVCDTLSGVTAFDKGFEKTSAQSNDKCLTADEENQFLKESSNSELINSIKPQLNEAIADNTRQPELSHVPSVKENMDIPDNFKVKEAFSKQTQTRNETMEERPLLIVHEGTTTISPLMMIYNQDVPFKDMTRQSEKMDESSSLPEINAEIGSMSESSDDEFLSTRIVRRRVVIQADEMPDIPTQTVTEEKYQDENGHIVVRTVTRKIIRKCVSSDGVEREEVSIEGSPQRSISVTEGDGYSKVVKRTILKSEGDHTEVTFAESEGFSASQATGEVRKVSLAERTTVVEGKRTVTHKGDLSLASDLPSAEEDFNQGPHA
ncbi:uncharacterized protein ank2a isoform X1 [Syngnathus typhle]|uniref:uncharacterized protein ank2a isoform X1 n=1 Tax=Syngnathus typhle TaxID=161592 RepID=UPI002A6B3DE2|nr:uncharacterized protein ank2a isoform X1 [Syngnathus typhle]